MLTWHDWKAFTTNPELQARYTVEVRNRFQLLDTEENPNTTTERLMTAHTEATKECVPVVERTRKSQRSKHPEIVTAREEVVKIRARHDREMTESSRDAMNKAKQQLFSTYDRIKEEQIAGKVERP